MRIVRIKCEERKKFKHHIDLRKPEESREYVVPETLSGCEEQVFSSSNLKRSVRFRAEVLERVNMELNGQLAKRKIKKMPKT